MKPIMIMLLCTIALSISSNNAHSQILKKLKDKVNKTLGSDSDSQKQDEQNASQNSGGEEKEKSVMWCDTVKVDGTPGNDGVEYTLAYSGEGRVDILYDESALGLANDAKGYRMILSERANNKQQYVVVENGKVIHTDTKVPTSYIAKGVSRDGINDKAGDRNAAMSKYIKGDTLKQDYGATKAQKATIQKIDDDQFEMALEMARQTDDYKSMSDAEKKEFEETMRKGIAKNNEMAGTTISTAAQPGGTVALVTGYNLVVKGKNYGKFQAPPFVDVSADETKIFAVGTDDKGAPVMIVNGKKTMLDKNKFTGMTGQIIRSPDQKKAVYIEQKKMSDQEIDDMMKAAGQGREMLMTYNVIKSDGSMLTVTDYNSSGKFRLSNFGSIISINEKTGDVYADNKKAGRFPKSDSDLLNSDAVMIGNDLAQVAYYNGSEGSLTYLDGTTRKMNIMFPQVVNYNGKSYLSWFRKCRNKIYIARFAY